MCCDSVIISAQAEWRKCAQSCVPKYLADNDHRTRSGVTTTTRSIHWFFDYQATATLHYTAALSTVSITRGFILL